MCLEEVKEHEKLLDSGINIATIFAFSCVLNELLFEQIEHLLSPLDPEQPQRYVLDFSSSAFLVALQSIDVHFQLVKHGIDVFLPAKAGQSCLFSLLLDQFFHLGVFTVYRF